MLAPLPTAPVGCAAGSGSPTDACSSGELAPERHRALQLGLLHADSDGLVELAAGKRHDGKLAITTRTRADHFLPGGRAGDDRWLASLLELARTHVRRGDEVFVAPAVQAHARGEKRAVAHTRALWVDVDRPGQLPALWAFLAERPCHLADRVGGERWSPFLLATGRAAPRQPCQSADRGDG